MRYGYKKRFLYSGLVVIILIILLHPNKNARRTYEFIKLEKILKNLYEDIGNNFTSTALVDCDYYDIVRDDTTLPISIIDGDLIDGHGIREGGEHAPMDCKPKYSTAIIVPYRDKAEQLRGFLVYMHMFLRKQQIHYKIYVVEQVDTKPYNKAKLMNIGAVAAMRDGYPCLVLHEMDLVPLKPSNLYACTKLPRHMSSSIDKYRFVLPYLNQFDGAISILSKQYKTVNGMSNNFYVKEDLFSRLEYHNIKICRFEPKTSLYHRIYTPKERRQKRTERTFSKELMLNDGLNTLKYTEVATVLHPLFTHIMVDL
ncbi:beta-1,4-galactosyltransferase 1-like isoform X2 [Aricia agestis]|uniref:beta-1,4-galactosyltransferase 1-like isoform X2 n=1 Tax=Aricia agestis TaxID=91739 RepID=UPI001C20C080|nr:beta-1,4-galactosyltransferase 1-like isoform X2 [Aricia agestis]